MLRIVHLKHIAAMMLAAMLVLTVQISFVQAKKIDGDRLLDPERLVEIRIEMSPQDWSELSRQSRNPATAFSGLPREPPYT